ncbi:UNVERIFIED_CONTAM: hypothetical protein NCL1_23457 [Trichonephila clavipes]
MYLTYQKGKKEKLLENTYVLTFSSFKKRLPVRLINTRNERRLVQRHETPQRVKGDIEDVYGELDNGGQRFFLSDETLRIILLSAN